MEVAEDDEEQEDVLEALDSPKSLAKAPMVPQLPSGSPTRPSSAYSPSRRRSSSAGALRRRPKSAQAPCQYKACTEGEDVRRASLATSSTRTGSTVRPLGSSAWQPCISGGIHASYAAVGRPQLVPQLGTRTDRGSSTRVPWTWEEVGRGDLEALIDHVPYKGDGKRKLTICPNLRRNGICRLPRCPCIHEPNRPVTEHWPFYNARAPTDLREVQCRFVITLGACPYMDVCPYNHEPKAVQEDWRKRSQYRRASCDTTSRKGVRRKSMAGAPAKALRSRSALSRSDSSSSFEESEAPTKNVADAVSVVSQPQGKAPSVATNNSGGGKKVSISSGLGVPRASLAPRSSPTQRSSIMKRSSIATSNSGGNGE
mmetsp:Transcript_23449/g.43195  ORF Transcript_23449/g.43195 Transcript_23449/m.43195 type:complete len:370 (-) Transcript_23449:37-1146(-)